ncbi:50S ribosomal protein L6 [Candidatus Falkowbacteria bacterium CG10_big_fil_rev_8_21_14_0_10_39_11]|uniref:Large ribosomal subunit protein uL6 n=1 Tax=Candidatus Falkowbacteria bacterium CG10_big_fil_rev_8_21_14_0_10_39_11 TaxID=1974565 RepID=A0A2H0V3N0_9BACT|nr:MAG: 50S ribosomal protein L6 [Candidatus Falkowbacteria bacterium CG10_big_fil_rev_8_21_14_0_10_39_11]
MSRVGKNPIIVPDGVTVTIGDNQVHVKGPNGELTEVIHPSVIIEQNDKELIVKVNDENNPKERALWGLFRSLVNNLIVGVTEGYKKELEINGVGYRAEVKGNVVVLNVGYSHQVEFALPDGVKVNVEKNIITISGINKQLVGQVAANIRKIRKPEPYKGKGIKYIDEVIRRKVGKTAGKSE